MALVANIRSALGGCRPAALVAAGRAQHQQRAHASTDVSTVYPTQGLNVQGTGGRSSHNGVVATVFGATGFLGRYLVSNMGKRGAQIVLPFRSEEADWPHLKVCGDLGQILPQRFHLRDEDTIRSAIEGSNVVINLLGRDFESYNFRFKDVHVDGARTIARVARECGVRRMIHVSACGASAENPSEFYQTKAAGEVAVKEEFPEATIVRPGQMVGQEDRFQMSLAMWAKLFTVVPVYDGGKTRYQRTHVKDVALAIDRMIYDESTAGQTYTLCGPNVQTFEEILDETLDILNEKALKLPVPLALAKLGAMPREIIQHKIFKLGPLPYPDHMTLDFLKSLEADYVMQPGDQGYAALDITPRELSGINIDYLRALRVGGYDGGAQALNVDQNRSSY